MSEFYDEVVFTDPYEEFYNTLMQGQKLLPQKKHEHQEHFSTFSDGDTLQRLAAAREWVHNQLRGVCVCAEIARTSVILECDATSADPINAWYRSRACLFY